MMFITTPSIILEHLKNLSPILSTNKINPLLEGFLFEIQKDTLKITAYSQDLRIRTSVPVNLAGTSASHNFEEGFVIHSKKIMDILQTLPEAPITFTLMPDENAIKLKTENGEYKINVLNGDQYPPFSENIEFEHSITIQSDILKAGLNRTLFAASDDIELRPNLCGIYCQFLENETIFTSTDTHRLIEYTRSDSRPESNITFIIPKKNVPIISKILDKFEDAVEINYAKGFIQTHIGEYEIFSKLASGDFPKYHNVFPKNPSKILTLDRNQLISTLRRVKVFSVLENNRIQFVIDGSLLKVLAINEEYNESAFENLTCTYKGEEFTISFNAALLLEQLHNIPADEIVFEMTEANVAVIIRPAQNNPGEKIVSLIMPLVTY